MSSYLRRAGSAELADGARLTWTVADGSRGRRWRAVADLDGRITHAVLIEVAPDRSVSRMELVTSAGLLTLHPDADASTLHGNVVTDGGVRHLSFAWGREHAVSVTGRPIADAVTAHRLAARTGVGQGRDVPTVVIDPSLGLTEIMVRFSRVAEDTWLLSGPDGERTLDVDPRGIPSALTKAQEWPMELDEA